VWPKFEDDVGKREVAIASADGLFAKGDMTLVAAAKNENRQAFEILVERHARRVFFAARRMTRTREDAENVVQQKLAKSIHPRASIRREIFLFHVANAHRHQRSPHVAAEKARVK
jgi:hypothetical protein